MAFYTQKYSNWTSYVNFKTFRAKFVLQIMAKLSNMTDLMPIDVEKKLMREPLGPLGGMYRILYHEELKIQWRLLEPFSPLHSLSGSVSSGSLVIKTQKSRVSKVKSFEFTGNSAIDPKDNRKWVYLYKNLEIFLKPVSYGFLISNSYNYFHPFK